MANVFLLSAGPTDKHGQLELEHMLHAAKQDRLGLHSLIDRPEAADVILFAERENAAGPLLNDVRAHPLVRTHREKCFVFNPRYKNLPLLPGVYACVASRYHSPQRTRTSHYPEVEETDIFYFQAPRDDAPYLYSFAGVTWTAPVRNRLAHLRHPRGYFRDTTSDGVTLRKTRTVGQTERDYMQSYADVTHESKFVLCPRGTGPSTLRLFESMMMGRAPVIISDDWVPPEGPSWDEFSFRVAEDDVSSIPALLERNEQRAVEMGHRAREAWEDWFSPDVTFHRVVESCLSIMTTRTLPESVLYPLGYLNFFQSDYLLKNARRTGVAYARKLGLK